MAETMTALVERNRAFLAAYAVADFGPNEIEGEAAFLKAADTEAGEVLCNDPPPVCNHADLVAAIEYIVEDRGFVQLPHERILRLALAYLNGRA